MRLQGKSALVTGGTGVLGEALVRDLHDAGMAVTTLSRRGGVPPVPEVTGLRGDVTDPDTLDFRDHDVVVHGAAFVGFGLTRQKEAVMHRTNVEGTRNVLDAAARDGVKKVLHVSSVAAVGRTGDVPRDEEWVWQRAPRFHSAYERSKYEAHRIALAHEGVPVAAVMPSIVLGLGDTSSGLILKRYLQGDFPARVDHPGRLAWVHARDVAQGARLALEKGDGAYILSEMEMTLAELLDRLERVTGVPGPRLRIPFWALRAGASVAQPLAHLLGRRAPVNQDFIRSLKEGSAYDSRRARAELGWEPDMDRHIRADLQAFRETVDG